MDYVAFPTFSSENLSIWFAQMESAFTLNGILAETDKYDYVLTNIPTDSLTMVGDIVLNPPTEAKYEHIKYEFIKRMCIHKLKKEKIGNKKPSEYLRKLKEIAGRRVSNEIILNVWLNNLPEKVREIVRLETTGNMDRLCEMADKATVLVTPTPSPQLIEGITGKQFQIIMHRMDDLQKQVQLVQLMIDGEYEDDDEQSSSQQNVVRRSKEAFNTLNSNTSGSPKGICWYHTIFGDNAIACVAPCQYKISPTGS